MTTTQTNTLAFDATDAPKGNNNELIAKKASGTTLEIAVWLWFTVAVIGQLVFVYYILFFYGQAAVQGDFEAWNQVLPHGFVEGQTLSNTAVIAHIAIAAIITLGGPLQLVPYIRKHLPKFHHYNGRTYIISAFLVSISGLYMVWSNAKNGDIVDHLGISFNAILIMVFAVFAVRKAMARDIKAHRRWALRLFLVMSGVWFFRIAIMLWMFINNGPVGFDPVTFTGPAIIALSFAQCLLPLAVLELYFCTQKRATTRANVTMACTLFAVTAVMGLGIFLATMGMWLPRV